MIGWLMVGWMGRKGRKRKERNVKGRVQQGRTTEVLDVQSSLSLTTNDDYISNNCILCTLISSMGHRKEKNILQLIMPICDTKHITIMILSCVATRIALFVYVLFLVMIMVMVRDCHIIKYSFYCCQRGVVSVMH